ncbi:hypothetical protein ABFX02_05G007100 [Erythranthe guttata]
MEAVRSERSTEKPPPQIIQRTRLQVWFIRVCSAILFGSARCCWAALASSFPHPNFWVSQKSRFLIMDLCPFLRRRRPLVPARNYTSNGFLEISCNGGLNQMRSVICDMVTITRLLNLTLVVPKLDKTSFWADPSDFEDIFDVRHFVNSLRDEIRIIKRLPKRFGARYGYLPLQMAPISWSNEHYYLQQILPLFDKHKVIHFNRTDSRLANSGISLDLQRLRCRVNFQALKFTPEIETLGNKLIRNLREKGPFLGLHLRYEMDMLAFSGCTHGCTDQETEELKQLRLRFN